MEVAEKFGVDLHFDLPVGRRAGVCVVVGGVAESPAGGPSHGSANAVCPVAPGAGALMAPWVMWQGEPTAGMGWWHASISSISS